MSVSDRETKAVALDFAAQLLACKAAHTRISKIDVDSCLRAAAECIILANQYREGSVKWPVQSTR